MSGAAGAGAWRRGRGCGAGSQPCCYADHSGSDSQARIMNASEDFDVRAEIYQQIQWGRNIKRRVGASSLPTLLATLREG